MKKNLFGMAAVLVALGASAGSASAQDTDVLSGDTRLACEAILCLSTGQRPSECTPSLDRYFGIKMRQWAEKAKLGYYAQDHAHDFEEDMTLFDWMGQWTQGEQMVRGTLGRMLFSNDDILKSVKVISGGEQGRMLFGKLILQKANVLVMDEPTNHLDMESIEALNLALENYPGTLVFVSHDREFVSSLATRIIELSPSGVIDFSGTYDDYLRSQGVTF